MIDCVELRNRTGRDVAIIVEGTGDDEWFYGQWFNDLPVVFFSGESWRNVETTVQQLRQDCPNVPLYGIVDRDFAEDESLTSQFNEQGLLKTNRFTLENYLLQPNCWADLFSLVFRKQGEAPDGWGDSVQVETYLETAYQDCLPVAVHNSIVKYGLNTSPLAQPPSRHYLAHPDAIANQNVVPMLSKWGNDCQCEEDLGQKFATQLAEWQTWDMERWQYVVSGKMVLRVLHQRFPRRAGKGQLDLDLCLNLYMDKCPEPPTELAEKIQMILENAGI